MSDSNCCFLTCIHVSHKRALLKAFSNFGALKYEPLISFHGPVINLSLFQTPMFYYCLSLLCIGHMDLAMFCNIAMGAWHWGLLRVRRLGAAVAEGPSYSGTAQWQTQAWFRPMTDLGLWLLACSPTAAQSPCRGIHCTGKWRQVSGQWHATAQLERLALSMSMVVNVTHSGLE